MWKCVLAGSQTKFSRTTPIYLSFIFRIWHRRLLLGYDTEDILGYDTEDVLGYDTEEQDCESKKQIVCHQVFKNEVIV